MKNFVACTASHVRFVKNFVACTASPVRFATTRRTFWSKNALNAGVCMCFSNMGIMICFKCWYAYTKDLPVGTPWKCPICSVKVAFTTDWADYYFQQATGTTRTF